MKVAFFDAHDFERSTFLAASKGRHEITFFKTRLDSTTAPLARDHDAVCSFANDKLDRPVLASLKNMGVQLIALRSAGYNHVDLKTAVELGLPVVRVPSYSPNAIAEHAVALMLNLNRKIHRSYNRVRELNFSLDGLVGFDMLGKTVGVVGVGRIGRCVVRILNGFGCRVLLFDQKPDTEFASQYNAEYVLLDRLLRESDIVSLHVPLTPETRHLISETQFNLLKPTAFLINTGRGALIETRCLIDALKHHRIAGAALDVYEEEAGVFFEDHSSDGIDDDALARLLTFPNVIVTSHQGFLTHEALTHIAETTVNSLNEFEEQKPLTCEVRE